MRLGEWDGCVRWCALHAERHDAHLVELKWKFQCVLAAQDSAQVASGSPRVNDETVLPPFLPFVTWELP